MFDKIPKEVYYIICAIVIFYFLMTMWGNKVWDINSNTWVVDLTKTSNINITQSNNQSDE